MVSGNLPKGGMTVPPWKCTDLLSKTQLVLPKRSVHFHAFANSLVDACTGKQYVLLNMWTGILEPSESLHGIMKHGRLLPTAMTICL